MCHIRNHIMKIYLYMIYMILYHMMNLFYLSGVKYIKKGFYSTYLIEKLPPALVRDL